MIRRLIVEILRLFRELISDCEDEAPPQERLDRIRSRLATIETKLWRALDAAESLHDCKVTVHDHEVVHRDEDGDELVIYERGGRTRIGVAATDGRGYSVFIDAKGAEKIIKRLLRHR